MMTIARRRGWRTSSAAHTDRFAIKADSAFDGYVVASTRSVAAERFLTAVLRH
jgi:hypothetical protein